VNYTKLPVGTYLVFGPELAPQVHMLSALGQANYSEADRIARSTSDPDRYLMDVYRATFGSRDVRSVVPAWSRDAMQLIATQYEGAHQLVVRGIAAAIALGRPWTRDVPPKTDTDGGTRVPVDNPPKGPKPGDAIPARAFYQLTRGV
jgi:hypothetical protein